ncbi:MAG: hypothetical protein ABMA13_23190 [Chthoniobacteraceae bacterium]
MTEAAAQLVALRHYRTLWFGEEWDDIAVAWQTEYDAVSAGTFTPLRITRNSGDGWSAEGAQNFEQPLRLAALQQFRADLDPAYALAVFVPPSRVAEPRMMLPDYTNARP